VFSIVYSGCDLDLGEFPKGHMAPGDILIGEWQSLKDYEHITIQKGVEVIDQNNRREYHFIVRGKGKRIFIDHGRSWSNIPKNPQYMELSGKIIIRESQRLEDTFSITWDDPIGSYRPFGIMKFNKRKGYTLYSYVGDPDNPYSRILLYNEVDWKSKAENDVR
jgi:hypothetical protein